LAGAGIFICAATDVSHRWAAASLTAGMASHAGLMAAALAPQGHRAPGGPAAGRHRRGG
jgi:hypothetical protein